jgi:predicted RNase H-like HicB family nuclease
LIPDFPTRANPEVLPATSNLTDEPKLSTSNTRIRSDFTHPADGSYDIEAPGEQGFLESSREEFDEAMQHAQTIYDFVLNLLPAEARPWKLAARAEEGAQMLYFSRSFHKLRSWRRILTSNQPRSCGENLLSHGHLL